MISLFKLAMLFLSIILTAMCWEAAGYLERHERDVNWMQIVCVAYRIAGFCCISWLLYEWFIYLVGL
jgi:hypothetical protein